MWKVFATLAKTPSFDYPFAVVTITAEGQEKQEILCRSRRDCLMTGNGIATGLMFAGIKCHPNTVWDDRIFSTER